MRLYESATLLALSLSVSCSHQSELEELGRRGGPSSPQPGACELAITSPFPGAKVGAAQDPDSQTMGTQLDLTVSVGAHCAAGALSFGLCQRDANGNAIPPAAWQGSVAVEPASASPVRVTVADTLGPQQVCVKLTDIVALGVERVCDGSETACAADGQCRKNTDSDPGHCGARCEPCAAGDHGAPSCVSGVCELSCEPGYHFEAGQCRARPSCKNVATACNGQDCCANDLISENGQPLRFVRGYDASGNATGIPEFQPATAAPVSVEPFYMDRYEVTVGRFRNFVDGYEAWLQGANPKAGRGSHPRVPTSGWQLAWNDAEYPTSSGAFKVLPRSRAELIAQVTRVECAGNQTWTDVAADNEARPINCANFFHAQLFCMWDAESLSSRLPTEAEWNAAAAGGGQQRAYPWSPASDPGNLEIVGKAEFGKLDRLPYPVGSSPAGAGAWGTLDLAGNVYEWTRDTALPLASDPMTGKVVSPYIDDASDPIRLDGDDRAFAYRPLRGGSFKHIDCATCDPKVKLRSSSRSLLESYSVYNDLGFRCVRNY